MNTKNILVFFCDQWRPDIIKCYGGDIVRTPNIDKLAENGFIFEQAYTPTAICSPARASLMTGLYPHRHQLFNNTTRSYSYNFKLRPEVPMISDWADKNTDYETAYTGKWHLGNEKHYEGTSFHVKKGIYSHPSPGGEFKDRHNEIVDLYAGTLDIPMEEFPDVITANNTKKFLKERNQDKPFMAFCAFPGPHAPWYIPEEFGIRYNYEEMPEWPNLHDEMHNKPINQKKCRLRSTTQKYLTDKEDGEINLKKMIACHFSYIELIDSMIGEVIQTLKDTGQYENTTIILTADHGDMLGAHGLLSKGAYMYDEIYRIPLIISDPSVKGHRINKIVNLMDLTATIMHMMSGKEWESMTPDVEFERMDEMHLHGKSILPLMENDKNWDRKVHYAQYHGDWFGHYTSRMVTDGKYKVIWNVSDVCEMYDLEKDPNEMTNVFYEDNYAKIRDEYLDIMVEEARKYKDGHAYMANQEQEKVKYI